MTDVTANKLSTKPCGSAWIKIVASGSYNKKKVKMNRGQDAVIAVREERARIGGIEAVKKTVIAATDEGLG